VTYRVEVHHQAAKDLKRLDRTTKGRRGACGPESKKTDSLSAPWRLAKGGPLPLPLPSNPSFSGWQPWPVQG